MTDAAKLHLLRLFARTVAAEPCTCDDNERTGESCLSCTAALLLRTINEAEPVGPAGVAVR